MAQFLRIAVAMADGAGRANLCKIIAQHKSARIAAEVDSAQRLLDVVANRRPRLAFISTDLPDVNGFEVADTLSRRYPGLYVAMVTPRADVEEVRRAMKAGARECLFEPVSEQAVLHVIDEARNLAGSLADRRGAIIAVMSSKGGVGKSTIAVNLAIALKQLEVGRVALVDGDLYFGDVATLLNIKPERTIHDLNNALEVDIADRFLHHHSTGIEVLTAPVRAEQAEGISPDRFRTILGMLQALYDYILVDATVSSFDTMLATLDVADLAIMISTLDVVCLRDVSQIIEMLHKLRFPANSLMLVGNRFDERVSLSPKDAERTLGMPFVMVVPREDRVVLAANRGIPTIVDGPQMPFAQRVRGLAKAVAAQIGRQDRAPS